MDKTIFYRTGEPCAYGHMAKRYKSNGACVECVRLRQEKLAEEKRQRKIELASRPEWFIP